MVDLLAGISDFVFENIIYFVIVGVVIYVFFLYFKISSKTKFNQVNRAEVERVEFIKRMKENKNSFIGIPRTDVKPTLDDGEVPDPQDYPTTEKFTILSRGKDIIGKIKAIRKVVLKSGNIEKSVLQMVVKPTIWKTKFENPTSKEICFQIDCEMVKKWDIDNKDIELYPTTTFDYVLGIYYDIKSEDLHTNFIKNDNLFRSDLNMLASIYFAKSQEQSTFDPEKAHQLAMKEKELQIELSKKKGQITSI